MPKALVDSALRRYPLANSWARLDRKYMEANWDGRPGQVVSKAGSAPVILTAPHAGGTTRDGRVKPADAGTGGLAEALGRRTGASVVAALGGQDDDANWDVAPGPLKTAVAGHLAEGPRFLLDLHGMRRERPVDLNFGIGSDPSPEVAAFAQRWVAKARERGLRTTINEPFDAAGPGTLTSFGQRRGVLAMQIEIGAELRSPKRDPAKAELLAQFMSELIEDAAHTVERVGSPAAQIS
jgi:hypothetical protein